MAKCPRCRTRQGYVALLFLGGNKTLVCKQCGASLRLNKWRLLPFALVVNTVAAFIGMTMILSKAYIAMLIVLCIWLLISLAVYPLVVSVRASNGQQT
jgi:uncharacterized protein (DUF983 family)